MMKIVYPAHYGLPVTFVYWKSKKKNKRYIYIHCCELTVPAVTWVLRYKLHVTQNPRLPAKSGNYKRTDR